jgi:hypothetical protein
MKRHTPSAEAEHTRPEAAALPRRQFLRGAGGALLALPALSSLSTSSLARAAEPRSPRRFFAIKSYSTQRVVDWYPRFSGAGYQARPFAPGNGQQDGTTICPERLGQPHGRRRDGRLCFGGCAPLLDLARPGQLSRVLGPRLRRYLPELLLIRGADFMPNTSHNDGGMLGNYAGGADERRAGVESWATIDQVLAFSPHVYPTPPPCPRSLHLSLGKTNTCSFTDNGMRDADIVQVQAHTDPRTAFYEVFGQSEPTARRRQRTLVDQVLDDLRRLERDPRLGAEDRRSLGQHVALVHELEASLLAEPKARCEAPPAPEPPGELEAGALARTTAALLDIALGALRCDRTRIVTFDVWQAIGRGAGTSGEDLAYAHNSAKGPRDWHERVHEFGRPEADREVLAINQWIADDVFTRVLDGLAASRSGGGSLLDDTLVFWGNELGMNHHNYSVPALLAGNLQGRLRTGQYLDFIDWEGPIAGTQENAPIALGVPHNRLLVTLLAAFGLKPHEYERFGSPGYGSYSTVGKSSRDLPIDYDTSRHGDVLPGVLA